MKARQAKNMSKEQHAVGTHSRKHFTPQALLDRVASTAPYWHNGISNQFNLYMYIVHSSNIKLEQNQLFVDLKVVQIATFWFGSV